MKKISTIFVIILRLMILEFIIASPRTDLLITNMTINFNTDYINGSFLLENNNKFSGFVNLLVPLNRVLVEYRLDVKVLGVDSRPSDLKGYTNFINKTSEVCTFLKNPMQTDPIGYLFYKVAILNKKNKLADKCPIQPGEYYVKDFLMSAVQWPVTPNLVYMTATSAYTFAPHKIMIAEFYSSGSLKTHSARTRKRIT